MDTGLAMTRLETAVQQQILLAGDDPSVEAAASAVLAALEPAVRSVALDLAGQAAAEVAAQMEGYEVEVVLADGEPTLRVRSIETEAPSADSLDARITLRLPPELKATLEDSARDRGESVNTWLIKTLSSSLAKRRVGRKVEGRIET